jgi:hypothetical protein
MRSSQRLVVLLLLLLAVGLPALASDEFDRWSALVQARTGPDLSQQSPHITVYDFDGGPTGPYDVNLDHWYLRYSTGGFELWAGRNELSFWHQDDWVRWGDANQVRATNLKGSELRVVYTIRPKMNLFARLFFVDAIDLLQPGDTTRETGNRVRIDWNVAF